MTFLDVTDAGLVRLSDRERVAARVRAAAWSRRTFALAVLGIFFVAAAAFALWPLTGTIVPWDSKNQFYPMFRFLGDSLDQGTVPLWNPYQFGGYPSVADPQSLLFTPTMLLFALAAPTASMRVFDAVVFAHLVLGAIGVLGLARRWRWHPQAGFIAALVFMLGGAASSRLEHTGMIISYAFFPPALWSLQAALDRRSMRLALVAGLVATLMAIGRDQVAYLLCLALVGAVLRAALRSEGWFAYLRARASVLAVAGSVTVAAMVVPILLALQFLQNSNRPGITYGMALAGSLDPINLLTLVAPNVFGSLDHGKGYWGPGAATLAGNDWTDPTIDYLFVGTVPLVLIVWHGLVGGRLLERGARYFALLLVSALVYAIGRHTMLFGYLFDWLPGVAFYRRPADATFLVNIALAFLSGYLLHRFVEEGAPRLDLGEPASAFRPVLVTILAAWLIGSGLAFAYHAGHLDRSSRELAAALCFVGAACLLLVLLAGPRRRGFAATLLVVATAGQLLWRNAASALNAESIGAYAANAQLPAEQAEGLAALRRDMAARRSPDAVSRVEIQGIDGPWQNAAMMFKLQNTAGYNPLRIANYEHAVGVGESSNDSILRSFPDTFRGYNSRLAAMLGLDYLVLDRPLSALPRHYPRPRASTVFRGEHFFVYRMENALVPRVHLATRVQPVDGDDVIGEGEMPAFDLVREATVEQADIGLIGDRSLVRETGGASPADPGTARIVEQGPNRVTVLVDAARPGVLVLHDLAYPGWVATVDGRERPVLRADLLFRGVEVPAGKHRVEFAFRPFGFRNLVAAAAGFHRSSE